MTRQSVDSSNITSIGYDAATRTLEVEFRNGSVHSYEGVDSEKHARLMKAKSVGAFFHTHIRGGKHKSKKLA